MLYNHVVSKYYDAFDFCMAYVTCESVILGCHKSKKLIKFRKSIFKSPKPCFKMLRTIIARLTLTSTIYINGMGYLARSCILLR